MERGHKAFCDAVYLESKDNLSPEELGNNLKVLNPLLQTGLIMVPIASTSAAPIRVYMNAYLHHLYFIRKPFSLILRSRISGYKKLLCFLVLLFVLPCPGIIETSREIRSNYV